jgi:hypothetical protein
LTSLVTGVISSLCGFPSLEGWQTPLPDSNVA